VNIGRVAFVDENDRVRWCAPDTIQSPLEPSLQPAAWSRATFASSSVFLRPWSTLAARVLLQLERETLRRREEAENEVPTNHQT